MVEYKPVHTEMNNCIEDIYQMVLGQSGLDYTWMYKTAWGFGLKENAKGTIGTSIYANRDNEWRDIREDDNLAKYVGARVEWEKFNSIKQVEQVVQDKGCAGVRMDTYVCPWNEAFHKAHIEHYVYIIKDDGDKFLAMDPYVTKEILTVEKQYFETEVKEGKIFYFLPFTQPEIMHPEIETILKECAEETLTPFNGKNDYDRMREFQSRLKDVDVIKVEFQESFSMQFAPIIRKLEQIMYGRIKFVEFLKNHECKENIEVSSMVKKNLMQSMNNWAILKSFIMKECIMKFNGKQIVRIQERFDKIINQEEETAYYIVDKCRG